MAPAQADASGVPMSMVAPCAVSTQADLDGHAQLLAAVFHARR